MQKVISITPYFQEKLQQDKSTHFEYHKFKLIGLANPNSSPFQQFKMLTNCDTTKKNIYNTKQYLSFMSRIYQQWNQEDIGSNDQEIGKKLVGVLSIEQQTQVIRNIKQYTTSKNIPQTHLQYDHPQLQPYTSKILINYTPLSPTQIKQALRFFKGTQSTGLVADRLPLNYYIGDVVSIEEYALGCQPCQQTGISIIHDLLENQRYRGTDDQQKNLLTLNKYWNGNPASIFTDGFHCVHTHADQLLMALGLQSRPASIQQKVLFYTSRGDEYLYKQELVESCSQPVALLWKLTCIRYLWLNGKRHYEGKQKDYCFWVKKILKSCNEILKGQSVKNQEQNNDSSKVIKLCRQVRDQIYYHPLFWEHNLPKTNSQIEENAQNQLSQTIKQHILTHYNQFMYIKLLFYLVRLYKITVWDISCHQQEQSILDLLQIMTNCKLSLYQSQLNNSKSQLPQKIINSFFMRIQVLKKFIAKVAKTSEVKKLPAGKKMDKYYSNLKKILQNEHINTVLNKSSSQLHKENCKDTCNFIKQTLLDISLVESNSTDFTSMRHLLANVISKASKDNCEDIYHQIYVQLYGQDPKKGYVSKQFSAEVIRLLDILSISK